MAETAEYGLILWDGKSKGTANNVVNLTAQPQPVVVYVGPVKKFRTVRSADDLKCLLAESDSDSVDRVVNELHLDVLARSASPGESNLPPSALTPTLEDIQQAGLKGYGVACVRPPD